MTRTLTVAIEHMLIDREENIWPSSLAMLRPEVKATNGKLDLKFAL